MAKKNILTRTKKLKAEALLDLFERRLGHDVEAEQASRRATELRPDFATAHQVLGSALHCQGRLDEAVASYRKSLELAPRDAQTHYLLGNALREQGALLEADAEYARANELQPGLPQVLCNIAQVLQQEGRYEEAMGYCQQTLDREPEFVNAIAMLADLSEKAHRNEEATRLIQQGLQLAPDNTLLNMAAARIARREGRIEDGIARLEDLCARLPEALRGEALMLLGQLYDKQKNIKDAFRCLSEGNRIKARSVLVEQDDSGLYARTIEQLSAPRKPGPGSPSQAMTVPTTRSSCSAFSAPAPPCWNRSSTATRACDGAATQAVAAERQASGARGGLGRPLLVSVAVINPAPAERCSWAWLPNQRFCANVCSACARYRRRVSATTTDL